MTQMEELYSKIENQRRNLQNLINRKHDLIDKEIIKASQQLDLELNIFHCKSNEKKYS